MTPRKREDRLVPMSRRRGRPPGPPPGAEWMVLSATIICQECQWPGLAMSEVDAIEMFTAHAKTAHPEIEVVGYELKEEK